MNVTRRLEVIKLEVTPYTSISFFHVTPLSHSFITFVHINRSLYITRKSRSKRSSILSIFLVIAYASMKAIDDNLLRWQQQLQLAAANFAKGGIPITPEHALCYVQYSARYLQNNVHTGLLYRNHAVARR